MKLKLFPIRLIIFAASLLLGISISFANEEVLTGKSLPNNELRLLLQNAVKDSDSFDDRFDAEVWLVDMSNRLKKKVKHPEKRLDLLRQISS